MRIPFPERIPLQRAGFFAFALFGIQSLEHTPLYFSVGCFLFIIVATLAFNLAGGLARPSGAYVFFNATLTLIVGICYKALLGESAESNLRDPRRTILVYVGGMLAIFISVVLSRRLSRKTGLLEKMPPPELIYRATVGCMIFGIAGASLLGLLKIPSLQTAFSQLNQLVPVALVFGTIHVIRASSGTRSFNAATIVGGVWVMVVYGILDFSKQGLFTPVVAWLVAVAATRYRLTMLQVISAGIFFFILFYYVVPYEQYTRRFASESTTVGERADLAVRYLSDPGETRRLYLEGEASTNLDVAIHYFDTTQGFFDRLQMVGIDDALINSTDRTTFFALLPIYQAIVNILPHFILPDKTNILYGNVYAHEIGGIIPDEDSGTGISFSPSADAYHMAGWFGIFIVEPLVLTALFIVWDSLCGHASASPWSLFAALYFSHVAPEGALESPIYTMSYVSLALIFVAFFSTYVAPVVAIVALGGNHKRHPRSFTAIRDRQPEAL